MNQLPRYWPILYILHKLKAVYGNFYIQKYIYLAKVEGNIPIKYSFLKDNYGPYTVEIKNDFTELSKMGLIEVIFGYFTTYGCWSLKIKDAGEKWIIENINSIPGGWQEKIDEILKKYRSWPMWKLSDYIYKERIRTLEHDKQIIEDVINDCQILITRTVKLAPSHNAFLLQGSLDLITRLLEKIETVDDPIKRDQILQNIRYYLEEIGETLTIIGRNEQIISELNLNDLEEKFSFIEEIYEELEKEKV
ncbi:MAG: hypothetical protein M1371_02600 [Actinobacteria bacterium]|nr:hypothetical protein [Actinomycetota bacterium]